MGLRFRKSVRLGKYFRINLSSKGAGYSAGVKGFRYTKTATGKEYMTYSIPGTGISYRESLSDSKAKKRTSQKSNSFPQSEIFKERVEILQKKKRINGFSYMIFGGIIVFIGFLTKTLGAFLIFAVAGGYCFVTGFRAINKNVQPKTKKCVKCKMDIDKLFEKCPYCNSSQGMSFLGLLSALAFLVIVSFVIYIFTLCIK